MAPLDLELSLGLELDRLTWYGDGESSCTLRGKPPVKGKGEREREREREERERLNTQFEHCHNFRQLLSSPLVLISVGPGELLSDRTGEGESEEKESLL